MKKIRKNHIICIFTVLCLLLTGCSKNNKGQKLLSNKIDTDERYYSVHVLEQKTPNSVNDLIRNIILTRENQLLAIGNNQNEIQTEINYKQYTADGTSTEKTILNQVEEERTFYDYVNLNQDNQFVLTRIFDLGNQQIELQNTIMDQTGNKISNHTSGSLEGSILIRNVAFDANDSTYYLDFENQLKALDSDLKPKDLDHDTRYTQLITMEDGTLGLISEDGANSMKLSNIDETGTIHEIATYNTYLNNLYYGNQKLYGLKGENLMYFEPNASDPSLLLNLYDYIEPCEITKLIVDQEENIYLLTQKEEEQYLYTTTLYQLRRTTKELSDKKERTTLSLTGPSYIFGSNSLYMGNIKLYQKSHPDITLDMQYDSNELLQLDDYQKRLNALLLAGDGPDIIFDVSNYEALAKEGLLTDLTPYFDTVKEEYNSTFIDPLRIDGKIYALPYLFFVPVIFVNQDLLEQYEISIDDSTWTWEDFYHICDTIAEKSGGLVYPLKSLTAFNLAMYRMGNEMKGTASTQKEEQTILSSILTELTPFHEKGMEAPEGSSNYIFEYQSMGYYNHISEFLEQNMLPLKLPQLPNQKEQTYSYMVIAMNADTKQKEASWDFIHAFLSEQTEVVAKHENFSANKIRAAHQVEAFEKGDTLTSDSIHGMEERLSNASKKMDDIFHAITHRNSYNNIGTHCGEEIRNVIEGKLSIDEGSRLIMNKLWTQTTE